MSKELATISNNLPSATSTPVVEGPINIFASLKPKNKGVVKDVPVEVKRKLSTLSTKSAMIRYLAKDGYTRHQISQILGIRYQHVYNVLNQIVKGK